MAVMKWAYNDATIYHAHKGAEKHQLIIQNWAVIRQSILPVGQIKGGRNLLRLRIMLLYSCFGCGLRHSSRSSHNTQQPPSSVNSDRSQNFNERENALKFNQKVESRQSDEKLSLIDRGPPSCCGSDEMESRGKKKLIFDPPLHSLTLLMKNTTSEMMMIVAEVCVGRKRSRNSRNRQKNLIKPAQNLRSFFLPRAPATLTENVFANINTTQAGMNEMKRFPFTPPAAANNTPKMMLFSSPPKLW